MAIRFNSMYMTALILLFVFGLGVAYFAMQNTHAVMVTLLGIPFPGVPMYMLVISSILFGLVVAWLVSMVNSISSFITLRSKDAAINQSQKAIKDLKEKAHELEVENARLKGENEAEPVVVEESVEDPKVYSNPSFFQRIRHNLS